MGIPYSKRMENYGSDFIKEMFAAAVNPNIISFAGGAPAPELYPVEDFRQASDTAFAERGKAIMAYDVADGILPLREGIARDRMAPAGVQAGPEDIQVLSGSQQGIDYAARLFLDEGDTIICEDPTYLGALNSFNLYRPNYVTVPMDDHGMEMDALEKALQANPQAKFIYTVPEFQNPTGITMSLERRKRLMALAEQYNTLIIEDSPYNEIRFDGDRLPAIKSFDRKGLVIYLGSFSKILSPGLRIGWVSANEEILSKYRTLKEASDFQAGTTAQWQLAIYLRDNDLEAHIKNISAIYKSRRDAALATMEAEFPNHIKFTLPLGGFFSWISVPGVNTTQLFSRAVEEAKVAYVPGESAFATGVNTSNIRLSYSQMTEDKIKEGIQRLAQLLHSL